MKNLENGRSSPDSDAKKGMTLKRAILEAQLHDAIERLEKNRDDKA